MDEKVNPSTENTKLVAEEKIKKNLLWFGLFSIVMLFAGWCILIIFPAQPHPAALCTRVVHLPHQRA